MKKNKRLELMEKAAKSAVRKANTLIYTLEGIIDQLEMIPEEDTVRRTELQLDSAMTRVSRALEYAEGADSFLSKRLAESAEIKWCRPLGYVKPRWSVKFIDKEGMLIAHTSYGMPAGHDVSEDELKGCVEVAATSVNVDFSVSGDVSISSFSSVFGGSEERRSGSDRVFIEYREGNVFREVIEEISFGEMENRLKQFCELKTIAVVRDTDKHQVGWVWRDFEHGWTWACEI